MFTFLFFYYPTRSCVWFRLSWCIVMEFCLALSCLVEVRNANLCLGIQSCGIHVRPRTHYVSYGSRGPGKHLLVRSGFVPLVLAVVHFPRLSWFLPQRMLTKLFVWCPCVFFFVCSVYCFCYCSLSLLSLLDCSIRLHVSFRLFLCSPLLFIVYSDQFREQSQGGVFSLRST